jgi:putative phosphoribosyl transferase
MRGGQPAFRDRRDAGCRLAAELAKRPWRDPVVLALPRGGVPVAFEVARTLGAPLDLLLVRKIGAPGHPEFGIGAVVDGPEPQTVIDEETAGLVGASPEYLEAERLRQLAEIERRRARYLGGRAAQPTRGRTAIVVDDGIATGGTARAAIVALRRSGAGRIVLAVPVAPPSAVAALAPLADEVVCLSRPEPFRAVGLHYVDFAQTTDAEVVALLKAAEAAAARTPERSEP